MTSLERDRRLLRTFAKLADTLVDEYDVVELMQQLADACREELDISAAGILLADQNGELELVASTSEAGTVVESLLLGSQGPALGSYESGSVVAVPDFDDLGSAADEFRRAARASGYTSMFVIPLRLRDKTIGTLTLLQAAGSEPSEDDLLVARALADVATIGILHERVLRETEILAEQLQHALNSRIVIEQAKGVVAYTAGVPIEDAFALIRDHSRSNSMRLGDVARQIVERRLTLE
ncbi:MULTISPECIES: GAF and ANTAR domain-containing protein [Microbacterium]|uniref:GAF and ANTAR domain-containing protein n=1 Tax=Microbacterium TaxID=33882 RepID=UPI0006F36856|nr:MULTISPECIES: GAF and ANTAR domain-containing protein [Microbacterium]KQR38422.1 transcriptional regulator [Microbacterium sp. Leaf159]